MISDKSVSELEKDIEFLETFLTYAKRDETHSEESENDENIGFSDSFFCSNLNINDQ